MGEILLLWTISQLKNKKKIEANEIGIFQLWVWNKQGINGGALLISFLCLCEDKTYGSESEIKTRQKVLSGDVLKRASFREK